MEPGIFISERNNKIVYIFGGLGSYGFLKDLWSFDLTLQIWEFHESFIGFHPIYAFTYTSFEYNSHFCFCLYGGYDYNFTTNTEILMYKLFRLNMTNLKWHPLISIGNNTMQISSITYYNENIYVAVSYNSVLLYKYDLKNNQTEYLGDLGSYYYFSSISYFFYFISLDGNLYRINLSLNYLLQEMQSNYSLSPAFTGFNNTVCFFSGFSISNNVSIVEYDENNVIISLYFLGNYIAPHSRLSSSLTQINAFFCLFGGIANGEYFSDLWLYDIISELWLLSESFGNSPSPRAYHAAASSGDALLIWGGEGNSGLTNDAFIYNFLMNNWIEILPDSSNIPSARKGACLTFNMPLAYLFGGENDFDSSGELWNYDFTSNKYTLISIYNIGLAYTSCQLINNAIFIYCGFNKAQGRYYQTIVSYKFSINAWTSIKTTANCGIYGISLQLGETFINYGGANYNYYSFSQLFVENNGIINNIEEGIGLYEIGYAYFQSQLYIFSGGASSSFGWLNTHIGSEIFGFIDVGEIFQANNISIICSPGTYFKDKECLLCPAGTYAEGYNNFNCTPCGKGKFGPNIASTSKKQCYPCYYNSFNTEIGAKRCLECPADYACDIGAYTLERNISRTIYNTIQPLKYPESLYDQQIWYFQLSIGAFVCVLLFIFRVTSCIKIEDFDIFKSHHDYLINSPVILNRTKCGGAFSILFIFLIFLLVITAILMYSLENIAELKALQPLPVLQNEVDAFYANIQAIAEFENYGDICEINGKCSAEIKVIASDFNILHENYSCQQTGSSCTISFMCLNCVIGSQASVRFILQSAHSYSSSINVNVTSTSSIPESVSSVYTSIAAQFSKLFVGSIDSCFYFIMTPSLFISYVPEFESNITGYHVTELMIPAPGTEYFVDELALTSQLGVTVYLTQSESGLYTERYQIQEFFLLLYSILGTIAGLMGFTRFTMQITEKNYEKIIRWKKNLKSPFPEIIRKRKSISCVLQSKNSNSTNTIDSKKSSKDKKLVNQLLLKS